VSTTGHAYDTAHQEAYEALGVGSLPVLPHFFSRCVPQPFDHSCHPIHPSQMTMAYGVPAYQQQHQQLQQLQQRDVANKAGSSARAPSPPSVAAGGEAAHTAAAHTTAAHTTAARPAAAHTTAARPAAAHTAAAGSAGEHPAKAAWPCTQQPSDGGTWSSSSNEGEWGAGSVSRI